MTIMEQATFIIFAMIIISGIIIAIWVHLKQKYYAADFERRLALLDEARAELDRIISDPFYIPKSEREE